MDPLNTLSDLIRNDVDRKHCFLCGGLAQGPDRTREDVVAKWIRRKVNIDQDTVRLRNGTPIRYRQLLVPCCQKCNGEYLSDLEQKVERAVEGGWRDICAVSDMEWFLWVGKIALGLMYKDCLIEAVRGKPEKGYLAHPKELDQISVVRHLLQFIRLKGWNSMTDLPEPPGSVLVFPCQVSKDPGLNWDLIHMLVPQVAAIRIGPVGIIVAFRDEGVIRREWGLKWVPLRFMPLHPIQFVEVVARVCWLATYQERQSTWCTCAGDQYWSLERVKAWESNPIEMFDFENLSSERWERFHREMQEIPDEVSKASPHPMLLLAVDYPWQLWPIDIDRLPCIRAGDMFHPNFRLDPENLPDVPWIEAGRPHNGGDRSPGCSP